MFGYDAPVVVFTVGAFAVWGWAMWRATRHPTLAWYHKWMLVMATLFWWVGESLAIRLGKYEYPSFPSFVRLNVPLLGGTPQNPGWFENWVIGFLPAGEVPPWELDRCCRADSYAIPLPVVALEAALLYGLFRLAATVLRKDKTQRRWQLPVTAGGLCALLYVNVFAVLDPVVSGPLDAIATHHIRN